MSAMELLMECQKQGIRFSLVEDQLKLSFTGESPDSELVAQIKANKADIIRVIRHRKQKTSLQNIQPVPCHKKVLASVGQKRLWMLSELAGDNYFYNMPGAFKILGELSIEALGHALHALVSKHESLRTSFYEEDGTLFQSVGDAYHPLTAVAEQSDLASEQDIDSIIKSEQHKSFDLSKGELFRAQLLTSREQEYYLILNVHHIAADGSSIEIILKEVSQFYRDFLYSLSLNSDSPTSSSLNNHYHPQELSSKLEAENSAIDGLTANNTLDIQYADFAHWQHEKLLSSDNLEQDLSFYEQQLKDIPPAHLFPTDFPRPTQQSFAGGTVTNRLDKTLLNELEGRAKQQNTSFYTLLITVFSVLQYRYSQQSTVVLGTPASGRRNSHLEKLVGFFVNTQVFRCEVDGKVPFSELLESNSRIVTEMLAHQTIPFEVLVERLQPERSLSVHPIFQMMFTLVFKQSELSLLGCDVTRISCPSKIAKFDLDLSALVDENGITFEWSFNQSLFSQETIERIAKNYLELCNSIIRDIHTPIAELDIISESERTLLLKQWGKGPECPLSGSYILENIESRVRHNPEQIAIVGHNDCYSYEKLDQKANQLSNYLISLGVSPGDRVAVYLSRGNECILSILAVLKAGAAFVGIDPGYPKQRVESIIEDCQARLCISSKNLLDEPKLSIVYSEDCSNLESFSKLKPKVDINESDVAYMIYTSGSTGKPKGIMVEHGNLMNLLDAFSQLSKSRPTDAGSWWTSISFDVAIYEIFATLNRGATLYIATNQVRHDAETFLGWVQEKKINHLYLHFGYLSLLLEKLKAGQDFSFLKFILVGVEPISHKLLLDIKCLLPELKIVNGYGPSETTICSTVFQIESTTHHHRTTPIGKPIINTENLVLNDDMQLVPVGVVGELYIGGQGVSRGYVDSRLNEGRIIRNHIIEEQSFNLYKTGDLVRYQPDGNLEFISRKDKQIKLRGFRVELSEIENVLMEIDGVAESKVSVQTNDQGDYLVAFVVLTPTSPLKNETAMQCSLTFKSLLIPKLPEYMIPSFILVIDEMPLTTNGKVDSSRLPKVNTEDFKKKFVEARTPLEVKLVDHFQLVLGIEKVGVKDGFFDLGGHSLLATRLVSALNSELENDSVQITLKDLFEHATVEKIALLIANRQQNVRILAKERHLSSLNETLEEGVL